MAFIKATLFILFNLILVVVVISFFEDDISIEPIERSANPDFVLERYSKRPPVYLISYADGHEVFYRNQNALVKSALNKGVDYYFNYRRSHMDPAFYEAHKNILDKNRGAGYWLWKPYFILKTLKSMPENSILVYADSGIHFKKPIQPLLRLAKDHNIILIEYESDPYGTVRTIANKKILKTLGCNTEVCKNSSHIWAGFMVLRNTQKSRDFIKEWLDYCCQEDIIFGLSGEEPEDPDYKKHVDDQTVLSVLNAKYPNHSHKFPKKDLFEMVIWHHRHPDKLNIPIKFINMIRETQRIQKEFLNQPDFRWGLG